MNSNNAFTNIDANASYGNAVNWVVKENEVNTGSMYRSDAVHGTGIVAT